MYVPQGSRKPDFEMTITDNGAVPAGLGTATVTIVGEQAGAQLFRTVADAVDATTGKLTHHWGATETAVADRIFVHAEVDFGDGKPVWFPQLGEIAVDVV